MINHHHGDAVDLFYCC